MVRGSCSRSRCLVVRALAQRRRARRRLVAAVHDRNDCHDGSAGRDPRPHPIVISPDRIDACLNLDLTDTSAIDRLLAPTRTELDARPVATAVNEVGSTGAELIVSLDEAREEATSLQSVGVAA